jgi:diguanylate cyclase (GGDEF)-like protein
MTGAPTESDPSRLARPSRPAGSETAPPAAPAPRNAAAYDDTLRSALLDSRSRWRELVALTADLAFETDAWGRFVFVSPDPALGWPASTLLGQPAELLLADAGGATGFNPFRPTAAVRRRRAWLKQPDGSSMCLAFAVAPLTDGEGRILGARGLGQETTEQDGHDSVVAAALRRGEVLDHILWRMRQEVLAPRMMEAALTSLTAALGAEGAAVLDALGDGSRPGVLYQTGSDLPAVLHTAMTALQSDSAGPLASMAPDGRKLLICSSQTRFAEQTGLALWRMPGSRDWDQEEHMLASSACGIIRMILDHDSIQREMGRQARTDPLTGLLNRRAFMEEMARRLDRLDREGLPGTLMFVDLDHFKQINDLRGHEAGDMALCIAAILLRDTVRPADLVARLGGDEFALWLDGADDLSAAERAEHLRVAGPRALAAVSEGTGVQLTMSIGIATRWPSRGEDIETVLHRADQAMYLVKNNGRGHWRVAHPEDP